LQSTASLLTNANDSCFFHSQSLVESATLLSNQGTVLPIPPLVELSLQCVTFVEHHFLLVEQAAADTVQIQMPQGT
jgi:hypothetical protein